VAGEHAPAAVEPLGDVALRVEGVEGGEAIGVPGEQAVGAEGVDGDEVAAAVQLGDGRAPS
jgi:hypothetical protein